MNLLVVKVFKSSTIKKEKKYCLQFRELRAFKCIKENRFLKIVRLNVGRALKEIVCKCVCLCLCVA